MIQEQIACKSAGDARILQICPNCFQPSAVREDHDAGILLICIICGHDFHLNLNGEPHQPILIRREGSRESKTKVKLNYPVGMRTLVILVYANVRGFNRASIDWRIEPPSQYRIAINFYHGKSRNSKWVIYSAESRPDIPLDINERDLRLLKSLIRENLQELIFSVEGPDEVLQLSNTQWDVGSWGDLAMWIERDQQG